MTSSSSNASDLIKIPNWEERSLSEMCGKGKKMVIDIRITDSDAKYYTSISISRHLKAQGKGKLMSI